MNEVVRRVVTGHDRDGKAIVISDGPAPSVHTSELRPGHRSTDIWRTGNTPAAIDFAAADPTLGPRRQLPPANGTVVRISQIPPDSESVGRIDQETAKKVFASMGNESASTFAAGGRHPMMHRTESIDYASVLDGEVFWCSTTRRPCCGPAMSLSSAGPTTRGAIDLTVRAGWRSY